MASSTTTISGSVYARLRLSTLSDVPHIHALIHQMAVFEKLTHLFSATTQSLSQSLFPSPPLPPFQSPTVLILDLSYTPFEKSPTKSADFDPVVRRIELSSPVVDSEAAEFGENGVLVGGFVLCFPNYSSFLGRSGLYVEDIYVRECWRRRGLGRMIMEVVAGEASRRGMGRLEWCVLDWNVNAIRFYEEMGADVLPMWRICRLSGKNLEAYASRNSVEKGEGNGGEGN